MPATLACWWRMRRRAQRFHLSIAKMPVVAIRGARTARSTVLGCLRSMICCAPHTVPSSTARAPTMRRSGPRRSALGRMLAALAHAACRAASSAAQPRVLRVLCGRADMRTECARAHRGDDTPLRRCMNVPTKDRTIGRSLATQVRSPYRTRHDTARCDTTPPAVPPPSRPAYSPSSVARCPMSDTS